MKKLIFAYGALLILTLSVYALDAKKNEERAKSTKGHVYTEADARKAANSEPSNINGGERVDQNTSSSGEEKVAKSEKPAAESKQKAGGKEHPDNQRELAPLRAKYHALLNRIFELQTRRRSLQETASDPSKADTPAGEASKKELEKITAQLKDLHEEWDKVSHALRSKLGLWDF